jgi:hypothetical protein
MVAPARGFHRTRVDRPVSQENANRSFYRKLGSILNSAFGKFTEGFHHPPFLLLAGYLLWNLSRLGPPLRFASSS